MSAEVCKLTTLYAQQSVKIPKLNELAKAVESALIKKEFHNSFTCRQKNVETFFIIV